MTFAASGAEVAGGPPKRPMPGARCVFLGQVFQDRAQSVLVGVLGVGTR